MTQPLSRSLRLPLLRNLLVAVAFTAGSFMAEIPCQAQEIEVPRGKIYWIDRGTNQIFRADFDGASPELLLDGDQVPGSDQFRGLAIDFDAGVLFFCDNSSDSVFRTSLGNPGVVEEVASGLGFPADIAVDSAAAKVYWCDRNEDKIQRSNYDGSALETVVSTESPYFLHLDPAAGKLYWGDFSAGNIFRANLADGSAIENLVSGIAGQTRGVQLDPVENKLYWVSRNEGKIQRRDVDGGDVEDVYTGLDTPHGMTLDIAARKVYWADTGTNAGTGVGENLVSRGDMDGGSAQEILSSGTAANDPWDLVLDTRSAAFAAWQARFHRQSRGEEAAPASDPDSDGMDNLIECALGSHPLILDGADRSPRPIRLPSGVGLEFLRPDDPVPGLTIAIEQSSDLQDWSVMDVVLESEVPESGAVDVGRNRVVYQLVEGSYIRIRVEVP